MIASLNTCTAENSLHFIISLLSTQLPCARSHQCLWKEVKLLVLGPPAPFLGVALAAAVHLVAEVHMHLESKPNIDECVSKVNSRKKNQEVSRLQHPHLTDKSETLQ